MTIHLDSDLLTRFLNSISVILKLKHPLEPPGLFVKIQIASP